MELVISFKLCGSLAISKGKSLVQVNSNGTSAGTYVPSSAFFGNSLRKVSFNATSPNICLLISRLLLKWMRRNRPPRTNGEAWHSKCPTTNRTSPEEREWWIPSFKLLSILVPLILGIWGGKGQGKSFQCELVFSKMGINPIMMSAGELESGNAGEPAKLIRQRYREAADIIKKGKMCVLFINDLDAGAGRMGGTTQYTVNNQMVNATLMNIADSPTNVQLPGMYNKQDNPRVPLIVTGNDFSTLYAPLIRDGRMDKFYWAPTREDRIGVCTGIFKTDNVPKQDIVQLVDTFQGQSIDFFGAIRARVYDDEIRKFVSGIGVENVGKRLVNSKEGPPNVEQPKMSIGKVLEYGNMLVQEQENVNRVQLADKYMREAALGDANDDAIKSGTFYR